jgi:hypothetical protein
MLMIDERTTMRHMLIISARSAKLACGPAIDAYFPMESKALDPSGIGKIHVTMQPELVTCPRCVARMPTTNEHARLTGG